MVRLLVVVSVCALTTLARGYSDLDDKLNYDEVVKSRAELKKHVDCFLDKTPYSAEEKQYKNHAFDAIWNSCKFCSSMEKHYGHVFLSAMKREFPAEFQEFLQKNDPEGSHIKATIQELYKF